MQYFKRDVLVSIPKLVQTLTCLFLSVACMQSLYASEWTNLNTVAIQTDQNEDGILDIILIRKRTEDVPYQIDLVLKEVLDTKILYGEGDDTFSTIQDFNSADLLEIDRFNIVDSYIGDFDGNSETPATDIIVRTYDLEEQLNRSIEDAVLNSYDPQSDVNQDDLPNYNADILIKDIDTANPTVSAFGNQRTARQTSVATRILSAPANEKGISVNVLDAQKSAVNIPLQVVANIGFNASTGRYEVPQVIVLLADSFSLNSEIELIGPTTDLLLVTTNPGLDGTAITCSECSFYNFQRITLAVADRVAAQNPWELSNAALIGELRTVTRPNGRIEVGNLNAPGVLGLEFIASDFSLTGEINTHQRVNADPLGGYTQSDSGALTMGGATIEMALGPTLYWNYDSQAGDQVHFRKLKRGDSNPIQPMIGGSIKASAVRIQSEGGIDVRADIDTRTDLISTIRYRGFQFLSNEGVTIETFGGVHHLAKTRPDAETNSDTAESRVCRSGDTTHDLVFSGNILTNGNAVLASARDINLSGGNTTHISGRTLKLYAGNDIYNEAMLTTRELEVDGCDVQNRGNISTSESALINADKSFRNQYTGRITGKNVEISAKTVFRNGSRTPYQEREQDLVTQLLEGLNASYFDNLDNYYLGSFYLAGINVETEDTTNYVMEVDSSSAHIFGTNVVIKSEAFENINPYYIKRDGDSRFVFDPKLTNQISVTAINDLDIYAKEYLLNSSAMLRADKDHDDTQITLTSKTIVNERYRALSGFVEQSDLQPLREAMQINLGEIPYYDGTYGYLYEGMPDLNGPLLASVTTEDTYLKFADSGGYFSPPGSVVSLGNARINASEGFLNNIGYFEVFRNAYFNVPRLHDYGLEHAGIEQFSVTNTFLVANPDHIARLKEECDRVVRNGSLSLPSSYPAYMRNTEEKRNSTSRSSGPLLVYSKARQTYNWCANLLNNDIITTREGEWSVAAPGVPADQGDPLETGADRFLPFVEGQEHDSLFYVKGNNYGPCNPETMAAGDYEIAPVGVELIDCQAIDAQDQESVPYALFANHAPYRHLMLNAIEWIISDPRFRSLNRSGEEYARIISLMPKAIKLIKATEAYRNFQQEFAVSEHNDGAQQQGLMLFAYDQCRQVIGETCDAYPIGTREILEYTGGWERRDLGPITEYVYEYNTLQPFQVVDQSVIVIGFAFHADIWDLDGVDYKLGIPITAYDLLQLYLDYNPEAIKLLDDTELNEVNWWQ